MSGSDVALSSAGVTGEPAQAISGARRSWADPLRGSIPALVTAAVLLLLWYGLGLWRDATQASETLGAGAPAGQLLKAAWNLPLPWVPLPHQVLGDFLSAVVQPLDAPRGLWVHWGATGLEALLGLVSGTLLGLLIATVFVHSRPLEDAFLPYVVASQTIPVIALAPIVISILGISLTAKVVVAAYLTFFAVAVSTVKGFKSVDPLARELMRSYAATPWQVYWKLRFPVALPFLFTGLKVAATASLVGAIIAELPFGSTTGLGARLLEDTTYGNTIGWWSTMLAAAVLGIVAFGVIVLLERLLVRRRPTGLGG